MISLHYPKYRNLSCILGNSDATYLFPLRIPVTDIHWPSLCNPSIYDDNGQMRIILRNVNYIMHNSIDPDKFWSSWGPLHYLTPEYDYTHLRTRNWLCEYKGENIEFQLINTVHDTPEQWEFVGLEDARLVRWDDKLLAIGVRRDDNPTGIGRMEIMEIDESGMEISRTKIEVPWDSYCEKNWVPIIDMPWHFMRTSNPVCIVRVNMDEVKDGIVYAEKIIERPAIDVSNVEGLYNSSNQGETLFRGSSQVIPYKNNTHIAIIHTCELYLNEMRRKVAKYLHHFILWDSDWNIIKISPSFSFNDHHVEFTNGLVYKNNEFYIPFALQDNFSFLLRTSEENIDLLLDGLLEDNENLEFLPNASIFYNNFDGFEKAESEAFYCISNGYLSEAYSRYWRMFERSFEFPISPEKQSIYLINIIYSLGWGIRDKQVGIAISYLELIKPENPEILMIIADYFYHRGDIGMARTYLNKSVRLIDDDYIFEYISKQEYDNIIKNINNEYILTCSSDKFYDIEKIL